MRASLVLVPFVLVAACAGPDAAESALLLVTEGAREHGVSVEVGGREVEPSALPVAVDPEDEAWLVSGDERERLALLPGEIVQIDAAGEVRRSPVDADRLVVAGSADGAASLAELLGADVTPLGGSSFALLGRDVTWIGALLHDVDVGDVRAFVPSALGDEPTAHAGWSDRRVLTFDVDAPIDVVAPEAALDPSVPSAASLVGVYTSDDVVLVVDAAGGWTLTTRTTRSHGRWSAQAGGVALANDDGSNPTLLRLTGGASLVDDVGIQFAPAAPSARLIGEVVR